MGACGRTGISTGKPDWLRRGLPSGPAYEKVRRFLDDMELHTVCREARCPNRFECFSKGTATFMILGDRCTRNCRFCAVRCDFPDPPDDSEPERIAEAVARLDLRYVVITSVTRDDLADGGASIFAETIEAIRLHRTGILVEVLIPDLQGNLSALQTIVDAGPQVLNHNIETVARLYPEVRPQARYDRSLDLLAAVKRFRPKMICKSGIMLGLGETADEIRQVWDDLRLSGCDILTMGQYLQPSSDKLPVERFIPPQEFALLRSEALSRGFAGVASGPFVRSSYEAEKLYEAAVKSLAG